jgi:hypothetical protein
MWAEESNRFEMPRAAAPRHRAQPRQQFFEGERLGQKVVRAPHRVPGRDRLRPFRPVSKQDRRVDAARPQPAAHREPS